MLPRSALSVIFVVQNRNLYMFKFSMWKQLVALLASFALLGLSSLSLLGQNRAALCQLRSVVSAGVGSQRNVSLSALQVMESLTIL